MKLVNILIKLDSEDLTETELLPLASRNVRYDVTANMGDYIAVILSWEVNHPIRYDLDGKHF